MKTVALLHPGEMGAAIGACLGGRGLRVVWASAGRSTATRFRANAVGLEDLGALERAEIFEPRGIGAEARRRAAASRRPDDPQAASSEAGADRGAHLAGMKQRDCFHDHEPAARVNVPASRSGCGAGSR